MNVNIAKPIATLIKGKKKVNLMELAQQRGMYVDSFKTKNGETIKVLTNDNELDCVVLKNGKVKTARGVINKTEEAIDDLYCRVIQKVLGNAADKGKAIDTTTGEIYKHL